jgi:chromosome condensin MukBEF MukE localization factor
MGYSPAQLPPALAFFADEEAEAHFAALDFALRNGQHAQQSHPQQRAWFGLLHRQRASLQLYYRQYFGLALEQRRQSSEPYYYLRPIEGGSCQVPESNLSKLEPAHVIIALLLCKIALIDYQEFNSVEALFMLLREEYSAYREGLFRQLLHLKNNKESEFDEKKMHGWVKQALTDFEELGWMHRLPGGAWRVLPSLDRIRELYQDEIQNMATRYSAPHA